MKTLNNKLEEKTPISKLTPHPDNPRNGDTEAIGASLNALGFYGVVIAQLSTGRILAGNHRYHVALEQGATHLPVAWVDVDDETALKLMLGDNRTSDLAWQDDTQLAKILQELAAEDTLIGTGYDTEFLDDLLRKIEATSQKSIDPTEAWNNMPAYSSQNLNSVFHVTVHFATEEDVVAFFGKLDRPRRASMWWPVEDSHVGSTVKEHYVSDKP